MEIEAYNSSAWDREAERGNPWTIPVTPEEIAEARRDQWEIVLTARKKVPRSWLGDVRDRDVLCLASGGGQQVPILAAAGARVTCLDNSARQLERDREVALRENLAVRLEQGDAADLSRFADASFDLIVHPCSNCFIPVLEPVWRECFRVLRAGGRLLVGFTKPEVYIFDVKAEEEEGVLRVRHRLPYSDLTSLLVEEKEAVVASGRPLEFSHTLDEQIGGILAQGFVISGFYEDWWEKPEYLIDGYMPAFIALKADKPR